MEIFSPFDPRPLSLAYSRLLRLRQFIESDPINHLVAQFVCAGNITLKFIVASLEIVIDKLLLSMYYRTAVTNNYAAMSKEVMCR